MICALRGGIKEVEMDINQTVERLGEVVKSAEERFKGIGVKTSVEVAYMDSWMRTLDDPSRAKYVTVSLVLTADGVSEGDEYCLSVGARVSRKKVTDEIIERDIAAFNSLVDDAYGRIIAKEDRTEAINELANEAAEDFDKLVANIKTAEKKQRIYSIVGIVAILAVFAIFLIVSLNV